MTASKDEDSTVKGYRAVLISESLLDALDRHWPDAGRFNLNQFKYTGDVEACIRLMLDAAEDLRQRQFVLANNTQSDPVFLHDVSAEPLLSRDRG